MRFLIDNALSPVLATLLSRAGHDALHVRTIELQRAEDIVIFDKAAAEHRILVSADTDFGALLAACAILSNLPQLTDPLERGSIVTFEPSRVRVRALPINTTPVDD